jgi:hypothetical protein
MHFSLIRFKVATKLLTLKIEISVYIINSGNIEVIEHLKKIHPG